MAVARTEASWTRSLHPADRRADRPRPVRRRSPRPARPEGRPEPSRLDLRGASAIPQGASDLRNGCGDQVVAKILLADRSPWPSVSAASGSCSSAWRRWSDCCLRDGGTRILPWVFVGPALALLAVYLVYPAAGTILRGFQDADGAFTLENYAVLADPDFVQILRNNVLWLIIGTVGSVGLGLLIAWPVRSRPTRVAGQDLHLPAPGHLARRRVGHLALRLRVAARRPAAVRPAQRHLDGASVASRSRGSRRARSTSSCEIVILIWLQTGFAMVVLSAAIKGVLDRDDSRRRASTAPPSGQVFLRVIVPDDPRIASSRSRSRPPSSC